MPEINKTKEAYSTSEIGRRARPHGAETRHGEHGLERLDNVRHISDHTVAFAHAGTTQRSLIAANASSQLAERDAAHAVRKALAVRVDGHVLVVAFAEQQQILGIVERRGVEPLEGQVVDASPLASVAGIGEDARVGARVSNAREMPKLFPELHVVGHRPGVQCVIGWQAHVELVLDETREVLKLSGRLIDAARLARMPEELMLSAEQRWGSRGVAQTEWRYALGQTCQIAGIVVVRVRCGRHGA